MPASPIVLVTGGSRGLGRSTVEALARRGVSSILTLRALRRFRRARLFHRRALRRRSADARSHAPASRLRARDRSIETAPAFWLVDVLWFVLANGRDTGGRFSLME